MIIGRVTIYKDESFDEVEEQWSFETLEEVLEDEDVKNLVRKGIPFEFYSEEVDDDYFE